MNLNIYTVYDAAVQAYMQPFFARSHGEALRSFTDACNDQNHQFSKHIHDYHLFHIGIFNDSSAALTVPAAPEKLISGTESIIKT